MSAVNVDFIIEEDYMNVENCTYIKEQKNNNKLQVYIHRYICIEKCIYIYMFIYIYEVNMYVLLKLK